MQVTCDLDGEFVRLSCDGQATYLAHEGVDPETVLAVYRQFQRARGVSPHLDLQTVDAVRDVIDLVRFPDMMRRVRLAARGILRDANGDDIGDRCPDWLLAWADVYVRDWLADHARSQEPLAVWRGGEVVLKTDALIERASEHVERALAAIEAEGVAA